MEKLSLEESKRQTKERKAGGHVNFARRKETAAERRREKEGIRKLT